MPRLSSKRHRAFPWWGSLLATAAIFTCLVTLLLLGVENAERGARRLELQIVERAVNRAVVSCYAMEGFYPPNIDYLIENYGLNVDLSKYYVHHEAFAPNIYPTVWVVRR